MSANEIEQRLLFHLRDKRHNDVFSGACAVDLVVRIRAAAQTMVAEARTTESDFQIAAQHLDELLTEMDAARVQLGLTEFHEITLSQANMKLCPGLWPFC